MPAVHVRIDADTTAFEAKLRALEARTQALNAQLATRQTILGHVGGPAADGPRGAMPGAVLTTPKPGRAPIVISGGGAAGLTIRGTTPQVKINTGAAPSPPSAGPAVAGAAARHQDALQRAHELASQRFATVYRQQLAAGAGTEAAVAAAGLAANARFDRHAAVAGGMRRAEMLTAAAGGVRRASSGMAQLARRMRIPGAARFTAVGAVLGGTALVNKLGQSALDSGEVQYSATAEAVFTGTVDLMAQWALKVGKTTGHLQTLGMDLAAKLTDLTGGIAGRAVGDRIRSAMAEHMAFMRRADWRSPGQQLDDEIAEQQRRRVETFLKPLARATELAPGLALQAVAMGIMGPPGSAGTVEEFREAIKADLMTAFQRHAEFEYDRAQVRLKLADQTGRNE